MENTDNNENNDLNTLEDPGTVVGGTGQPGAQGPAGGDTPPPKKKKRKFSVRGFIAKLNIYFLFFVLVVIIASLIVYVGYQRDRDAMIEDEEIFSQELTAEELAELAGSDSRVGDPQQTLSVESNAVFAGQVLIRDSLDVAGTIRVGGSLSLPGITVSGTSNFDQIQANNLSIAGDTNVQGQLSIEQNLTVSGGASFGGAISAPSIVVDSLQLTGDLQVNRHIDAGGPTPSVSRGGAIGSGGTVSISGTDTAGTVVINPGGGAGSGPVATVTFANGFSQTPHIVVTPVNRSVDYYITRNTNSFTIFIAGGLSSGSFAFDYIAID
jgi:cytoskeletal protein CcmA (bactofilin family)